MCIEFLVSFAAMVGSWLDLAKLVSSADTKNDSGPLADFALNIGSEIYVDVNDWHLYLKDMKGMSAGLSRAIAVKVQGGDRVDEAMVEGILKKVAITLGGGRTTLPMLDVMPLRCVQDLASLARRFEDEAR